MSMRGGVRIALDWGRARIGVAACDPAGILAHPVETVPNGPGALARIGALVAEYEPIELVLGLPRTLAGTESHAAADIRAAAEALARACPDLPLRLVDERLTTAAATRQLRSAGRDGRRQRGVIDQAAAVGILTSALETERSTGAPPGELFHEGGARP
jgi:putative Holliday junction resolvase